MFVICVVKCVCTNVCICYIIGWGKGDGRLYIYIYIPTWKRDVGATQDVFHEKAILHRICANWSWHWISCKIHLTHFLAFVSFPSPLVGRPPCHLQILYPGWVTKNESREDHVGWSAASWESERVLGGHPYRTNRDIRKKGPLSPASETKRALFL